MKRRTLLLAGLSWVGAACARPQPPPNRAPQASPSTEALVAEWDDEARAIVAEALPVLRTFDAHAAYRMSATIHTTSEARFSGEPTWYPPTSRSWAQATQAASALKPRGVTLHESIQATQLEESVWRERRRLAEYTRAVARLTGILDTYREAVDHSPTGGDGSGLFAHLAEAWREWQYAAGHWNVSRRELVPGADPSASADVTVYCDASRLAVGRSVLGAASRATGIPIYVEPFDDSGSLFRRLFVEREAPGAQLILTSGPFLAEVAVRADLLEAHEPAVLPPVSRGASGRPLHGEGGRWAALDFSPFWAVGAPTVARFSAIEPDTVPRLAVPHPVVSPAGHLALLAVLHRARTVDGDYERGWDWWDRRAASGLLLVEDDAEIARVVNEGAATHGLLLGAKSPPVVGAAVLAGLAPIPNVVAAIRQPSPSPRARQVLDWLAGPDAAEVLQDHSDAGLSPWHAETNGLAELWEAAPPFDVAWMRDRFYWVRDRWSEKQLSEGRVYRPDGPPSGS